MKRFFSPRFDSGSKIFPAAILSFVMLLSAPSRADEPSPENRALAEVLFRDAKTLSEKNQLDQACPKFQESHRLDPKPGTILNLAVCHEKQGLVASAWVDYIEAAAFAARAGQKDRETFAKDQAAKLEKLLPRVVVRIPVSTPGIVVKLDSAQVSEAALGMATPINPGKHNVEAAAPGYRTWTNSFVIEKMPDNVEIVVPKLEPVPGNESVPPPGDKPHDKDTGNGSVPIGPEKPKTPPTPPPPPSGFNKPLWIGVALGGVGLAGMILGTVYGVRTLNLRDEGNAECGPPPDYTFCTTRGLELQAQAASVAPTSTIGFVVGGVGLGAGAILVLLGMRKTAPAPAHAWVIPQFERSGAGVSAGVRF